MKKMAREPKIEKMSCVSHPSHTVPTWHSSQLNMIGLPPYANNETDDSLASYVWLIFIQWTHSHTQLSSRVHAHHSKHTIHYDTCKMFWDDSVIFRMDCAFRVSDTANIPCVGEWKGEHIFFLSVYTMTYTHPAVHVFHAYGTNPLYITKKKITHQHRQSGREWEMGSNVIYNNRQISFDFRCLLSIAGNLK